MDARIQGNVKLSYANPSTGSPAPGATKLKDVVLTHQSGRLRVLLEARTDKFELPLVKNGYILRDKLMSEGKLSIDVHLPTLRCVAIIEGADPVELRLFAACVRSNSKLDPREREKARAAAAAKPISYSVLGSAAAMANAGGGIRAAPKVGSSFTIVSAPKQLAATASASSSPSSASAEAPAPKLTSEQQSVITAATSGVSIFYTGSAGTGKSAVLHTLRQALPTATTAFTASTAVAACSVGGTTVHAFAGVTATDLQGFADGSVGLDEIVAHVRRRRDAVQRWQRTRSLVVDEISMLSAQDFDLLEAVARAVRGDPRPFGGIQLVLSGDFAQLPPVTKTAGGKGSGFVPPAESGKRYCFAARSWPRCISQCIELTQVFRQSDREL